VRVVGRHVVEAFAQAHADARPALTLWLAAAEMASWDRPQRVLAEHPRASLV
jgi:mRNA-degrading endonuclease HigB of HigAB toxin-antitoxin module